MKLPDPRAGAVFFFWVGVGCWQFESIQLTVTLGKARGCMQVCEPILSFLAAANLLSKAGKGLRCP